MRAVLPDREKGESCACAQVNKKERRKGNWVPSLARESARIHEEGPRTDPLICTIQQRETSGLFQARRLSQWTKSTCGDAAKQTSVEMQDRGLADMLMHQPKARGDERRGNANKQKRDPIR